MAFVQAAFSGQSAFSVEMQGLDKSTRIDAAFFNNSPDPRAEPAVKGVTA